MTVLLFVLAGILIVVLASLAHLYYALRKATPGYEDSRGFHGGEPEETESCDEAVLETQPVAPKKKEARRARLVRSGRH